MAETMEALIKIKNMDIENIIEQELVFKIEIETKDERKIKQKKVNKKATDNLKKMVADRLSGKTGEC